MLVKNELKKLQNFDSSYFRGRNYFVGDDGTQNYLAFQPMLKYFKTHAKFNWLNCTINTNNITSLKSKGLSDENIKILAKSNNNNNKLSPKLISFGTKLRAKFNGSCLKQDRTTYAYKKIVNIYIVFQLTIFSLVNSYPTLENCLF